MLELLRHYPTGIPEHFAKGLVWQILQGIDYCHEQHLAIQDFSLENCLLFLNPDRTYCVKVCDPGQATYFNASDRREAAVAYAGCVGKRFRPPELFDGEAYFATKIDSWCLGWSVFYMLTAYPLFETSWDEDNDIRWELFKEGDLDELIFKSFSISHEAVDFVMRLMALRPSDRISMKEALQHPFMRDAKPVSVVDLPYSFRYTVTMRKALTDRQLRKRVHIHRLIKRFAPHIPREFLSLFVNAYCSGTKPSGSVLEKLQHASLTRGTSRALAWRQVNDVERSPKSRVRSPRKLEDGKHPRALALSYKKRPNVSSIAEGGDPWQPFGPGEKRTVSGVERRLKETSTLGVFPNSYEIYGFDLDASGRRPAKATRLATPPETPSGGGGLPTAEPAECPPSDGGSLAPSSQSTYRRAPGNQWSTQRTETESSRAKIGTLERSLLRPLQGSASRDRMIVRIPQDTHKTRLTRRRPVPTKPQVETLRANDTRENPTTQRDVIIRPRTAVCGAYQTETPFVKPLQATQHERDGRLANPRPHCRPAPDQRTMYHQAPDQRTHQAPDQRTNQAPDQRTHQAPDQRTRYRVPDQTLYQATERRHPQPVYSGTEQYVIHQRPDRRMAFQVPDPRTAYRCVPNVDGQERASRRPLTVRPDDSTLQRPEPVTLSYTVPSMVTARPGPNLMDIGRLGLDDRFVATTPSRNFARGNLTTARPVVHTACSRPDAARSDAVRNRINEAGFRPRQRTLLHPSRDPSMEVLRRPRQAADIQSLRSGFRADGCR
ncbi:MAG: uncharacterized protein KVP18_004312 [Porospora cf. gigantea A]|uniref:uncharacterized protein n=1 Tax=Porospora cf. gigantea A TaxID=2853593 RepID=UPI003559D789|nr:MAG: hypothetical protein KVP18_004312 [Porospora cf. gigantea A]